MSNLVFKHSGDMGDIIYSLPTIRALGGGILLLDPTGGENEPCVKMQCIDGKTKLTKTSIDSLMPLLKAQKYIKDVDYFTGQKVNYNLDEFRLKFNDPNKRSKNSNLADLHLEQFKLNYSEVFKPWLHIEGETKLNKKIIIARSPRVQGGYGMIQARKFFLRDNAIFVGMPKEHEFFEWTFGIKIQYHQTDSIIDLFKVIKGAEGFIGNSSFPLSLAIGMGHPCIQQEVDPKIPTTVFPNMRNMEYF